MYCLVLFYKANFEELKPMKPLPKFLCIKAVIFFSFFQGVIIDFLVYYGYIKDVFNSDTNGDTQLLSSRLQNFLICIEMFLAAVAHQYSFPYEPFQINGLNINVNWFRNFLAMLDFEDVRQDISEHFDVVGNRIVAPFRSQPNYMQYTEADCLVTSDVAVSRTASKSRSYGSTRSSLDSRFKTEPIGKDSRRYRIVEIEEHETPSSSARTTASTSNMTQSTTSTTSSYGINVRGPEHDAINYRNPDV